MREGGHQGKCRRRDGGEGDQQVVAAGLVCPLVRQHGGELDPGVGDTALWESIGPALSS